MVVDEPRPVQCWFLRWCGYGCVLPRADGADSVTTSEREWLGDAEPAYTISEACVEIDELKSRCDRWSREYQLLAENLEAVRESRERLRIYTDELEGRIEEQEAALRSLNRQLGDAQRVFGG